MKLLETGFNDLFIVENFQSFDERGGFVKVFNNDLFTQFGINFIPKEIYYSISKKDVIRGMHFQRPPFEHAKLVYVAKGKILDVVLDIRKESMTYGKVFSVDLLENKNAVYIPSGFAHGFKSLDDDTIVIYNQTSCYSKEHDCGILWNNFGFDWGIENPIVSERDKSFIDFSNFVSVFK